MIAALLYTVTKPIETGREARTTWRRERLAKYIQLDKHAALRPKQRDHSAASGHIKNRAEWSNGAMYVIHGLDGDHHSALVLPEYNALVPERQG